MGKMASLFFNKAGTTIFYICIILYLYGDLSIYAVAVPKSLRDVICTYHGDNGECNTSINDSSPCWGGNSTNLTRLSVYRICLTLFILVVGPFVFFNLQKTKLLQIFTTIMRWLAFSTMIALAIARISGDKSTGTPSAVSFSGLPNLVGASVYSFMCHHSLPSIVTPIKNKSKLSRLLAADYLLILLFYLILCFTAILAFNNLNELYTLNFKPDPCSDGPFTFYTFVQYYLALFPVFTLVTSFPIIGITLRNNLASLFTSPGKQYHFTISKLLFPTLTVSLPAIIAMITDDVEFLIGITGSYAGAAIQYVIPVCLVWFGRKAIREAIGVGGGEEFTITNNVFQSKFGHPTILILVLIWTVITVGVVTYDNILKIIEPTKE